MASPKEFLGPGQPRHLSRRRLLALAGTGFAASLLAACQSAPPAAPTAAPPAAPTAAPAAPTVAPTAQTAPTTAHAAPTAAATTAAPTAPAAVATPAATVAATTGGTPVAATGTPKQGGSLVVTVWDDWASLDPVNTGGASWDTLQMLGDTLVWEGTDLKIYPGLADSWDVSSDGMAYTFHLHKGVKFHDGTNFNAAAVKFNLDRITGPTVKGFLNLTLHGVYKETQTPDDYTARVILSQRYAPLLTALSQASYVMVSPTAVQKEGKDYDTHPVMTGPYTFVEWIPKSTVRVKRNPDYNWGSPLFKNRGPGYPDEIVFRLIADSPTREATLETGEVQVARDLEPQEYQLVKNNAKFQSIAAPLPGMPTFLSPNEQHFPLSDLAVRQAMEYAMNQEQLVQVLWNGAYQPAHTPLTPGTFGYDKSFEGKWYMPDASKAQQILDGAGWKMGPDGIRVNKDGKKLEFTVDIINPSIQAMPIKMAQAVQAMYRAVGMQMDIKEWDPSALFSALIAGSESMVLAWGTGPEPDQLRAQLLSTEYRHGFAQWTGVQSPDLDKLLVAGSQELDPIKRKAIYDQIQDWVMKNATYIPMWYREQFIGMAANVRGVTVNPMGDLYLRDAGLI